MVDGGFRVIISDDLHSLNGDAINVGENIQIVEQEKGLIRELAYTSLFTEVYNLLTQTLD